MDKLEIQEYSINEDNATEKIMTHDFTENPNWIAPLFDTCTRKSALEASELNTEYFVFLW